jgi:predicted lysophospholipase L1 biosynthesis ABC-type transport system permease subunit
VSSLVMAVKDKQADIAILRTLGASPGSITGIFMIQGTMIGVLGTVLGLASGVLLALNVDTVVLFIENLFGFKFFAKDVYLISDLPSELQTPDVVITAVASFALSLVATIYPSLRAARVNPAEALRYEWARGERREAATDPAGCCLPRVRASLAGARGAIAGSGSRCRTGRAGGDRRRFGLRQEHAAAPAGWTR